MLSKEKVLDLNERQNYLTTSKEHFELIENVRHNNGDKYLDAKLIPKKIKPLILFDRTIFEDRLFAHQNMLDRPIQFTYYDQL